MSRPRILVLGAGGTGGYFGGRLAESGADVTFLVREGRRKVLSEEGLQIESQFGDAQIAVKTTVAAEVAPVYDAVILTCKAYDLDDAVAAIAPAVAPAAVAFAARAPAATTGRAIATAALSSRRAAACLENPETPCA